MTELPFRVFAEIFTDSSTSGKVKLKVPRKFDTIPSFTCNQYKAYIDTEIDPEPLVTVRQLLLFFHVSCAIANNCIDNQLACNICHFIRWAGQCPAPVSVYIDELRLPCSSYLSLCSSSRDQARKCVRGRGALTIRNFDKKKKNTVFSYSVGGGVN